MEKIVTILIVLCFFLIVSAPSRAGNRDMAEERVDELGELNKEAVNQIAGQPERGTINLKVRAIPGKDGYRFETIDKETTPSRPDTFLPQERGDKVFSLREGIARLANNKPAITPYRHYSNEGEYITFKDAIIRLSRSKK